MYHHWGCTLIYRALSYTLKYLTDALICLNGKTRHLGALHILIKDNFY